MFRFFGFAFVLQLLIFLIAAVPSFLQHWQSTQQVVNRVLGVVVAAVPVAAPTVILCANASCMQRLAKSHIDVLNPIKLKTMAAVQVVCFDKTGTLTGSVVRLLPVLCTPAVLVLGCRVISSPSIS